MPPPPPRRRSGLQLQVLSLYREVLRAARALAPASRLPAVHFARAEFRRQAGAVERLDIQRIEFLMRQARKAMKRYAAPGVTAFSAAPAGGDSGGGGGGASDASGASSASSAALIAGVAARARRSAADAPHMR